MYRFKTECEFEQEFGKKWRNQLNGGLHWASPDMDYLFGTEVSAELARNVAQQEHDFITNKDGTKHWGLCKEMIKADKNYNFRFKNEAEFEEEFGKNWRSMVKFHWSYSMDYLLGKPISNQVAHDVIHLGEGRWYDDATNGQYWSIGNDMITTMGVTTKPPHHAKCVVSDFDVAYEVKGNQIKVAAYLNGKNFVGIAKCSPEDAFDEQKGFAIALYRLAQQMGEYEQEVVVKKMEKHNVLDEL